MIYLGLLRRKIVSFPEMLASDSLTMRAPGFGLSLSAFLILLFLGGCSRLYFHESRAGDRYYQTASGEILRVSRSGYVAKNSAQLGVAKKAEDESDWDLKEFQVVSPSGHCLSTLYDDVRPTPCYALLWEVPLVILASPLAAIQDAFQEGNLSVSGVRTSEMPPAEVQQ